MQHDGAVEHMDPDIWDRVFRVNCRGTMLMIRHALPALLKSGNGSIINTSSGASLLGDLYRPAYASAKAAINTLTKYVAAQYGKRGVRCNVISPGMVITEAAAVSQGVNLAMYEKHHLTPYLGKSEDIAAMATLLASDDGRFVTGQIIAVDGGVTSHFAHVADNREAFDAHTGA
jgi:NAD(P)-dependent dehydrogenase (short-subunit alcohol dehydrogenase family)